MSADPKDSARKCSSPSALLFTADLLEFFLHPPFWVVYICFCFIVPLFFPHKYFSCSSRFQSTTSLLLHCFTRKCRTSRLELPPLISTRNSTWKRSAQSTAPEGDHPHYSLCECPLWPAWRTLSLSLSLSLSHSLSLSLTHTHTNTHTHTLLYSTCLSFGLHISLGVLDHSGQRCSFFVCFFSFGLSEVMKLLTFYPVKTFLL